MKMVSKKWRYPIATKATKRATEEVEVPIKQVEETTAASSSLIGLVRQLLLATVGAIALTRDETEAFVNKLVERGELAQKDAEKLLREVWDGVRERRPSAQKVGERVEEFLNRLNIPSRRDIEELNARMAQLAARVEELRKA